jgi:hypothetical protein
MSGLPLILAAVFLAGFLAACGGSDADGGGASSGDAGSGAPSGASSSAPEGNGADDDSEDESSEDSSRSNDSDDTAVLLEGCDVLIFTFQSRETDNEVPFSQALDALRTLGELESPLMADLHLVSEAYEPFFDQLRAAGVDNLAELNDLDEETRTRIESAVAEQQTPELTAATDRILDFIDEEC